MTKNKDFHSVEFFRKVRDKHASLLSYCQIWCMGTSSSWDQAASRSSSGGLSVTGIPSS